MDRVSRIFRMSEAAQVIAQEAVPSVQAFVFAKKQAKSVVKIAHVIPPVARVVDN